MKKQLLIPFLFFLILSFFSNECGAQWLPTNAPSETQINCLAIKGNTLLAGTQAYGLYISTDNGSYWSAKDITNANTFYCFAVYNNKIFAGTDAGMFESIDNGNNWVNDTACNSGFITAISIHGDTIYAGVASNSALLYSTDNGDHWTNTNLSSTLIASEITVAKNGNNIFVGTDLGSGIYKSADNGNSWIAADSGLTNHYIHSLASTKNYIFAGTGDGIFLSTNNGINWVQKNTGLPAYTIINAIAISGDSIYIATESNSIYLSTNYGNNWNPVNFPANETVYSLAISSNSIYIGASNGIFVIPRNNSGWCSINTGLPSGIDALSLAAMGNKILVGTSWKQVYFLYNNGNRWESAGYPSMSNDAIVTIGNKIYIGSQYGMYMSSDYGNTWTQINNGLSSSTSIRSLVIIGNNIFAGTNGGGVYSTSDSNINWIVKNTGLTNLFVHSLTVSGNNIYAGTANGVFISSDNGNTWTAVNNGLTCLGINSLAANGDTIFAATNNGVFVSYNKGNNWSVAGYGLQGYAMTSVAVIGNKCFAGADFGIIYLSTDANYYWTATNTPPNPMEAVESMIFYNDTIYAAISDAGVWKRALYDFSGINEISNKENNINIYPNPVKDKFFIETLQKSIIEILNIQGQLIKTITITENETTINIADIASGVYIIRAQTDRGIMTEKFIKE